MQKYWMEWKNLLKYTAKTVVKQKALNHTGLRAFSNFIFSLLSFQKY